MQLDTRLDNDRASLETAVRVAQELAVVADQERLDRFVLEELLTAADVGNGIDLEYQITLEFEDVAEANIEWKSILWRIGTDLLNLWLLTSRNMCLLIDNSLYETFKYSSKCEAIVKRLL